MQLALENINFSYGSQVVLHNVSFTLPVGEISLLLGPNGAGKSTLNLLLAGILFPDTGTISYGNSYLTTGSSIPYNVGFLGDRELIPTDQCIGSILKLIAKLKGIENVSEAVDKSVSELQLESALNKRFGELSHGFRQRVTLAQALLGDPKVLLLDEPGNGLDPRQFAELEKILIKLKRDRIILVSTHRIREAHSLADRVILLNEGRIVAQGRVDELLSQSEAPQWTIKLHDQIMPANNSLESSKVNSMIINPNDRAQLESLLQLMSQNPELLHSINSSQMNLEQLFMKHISTDIINND